MLQNKDILLDIANLFKAMAFFEIELENLKININ